MALLQINGVDFPTPSDYSVGIADIVQTERNALGTLLIERITQKKKISLRYSYCDSVLLSEILTAIDSVYFDVTYLDPITNTNVTSSFICSDRSLGMIDFTSSVPRYKDVAFELMER